MDGIRLLSLLKTRLQYSVLYYLWYNDSYNQFMGSRMSSVQCTILQPVLFLSSEEIATMQEVQSRVWEGIEWRGEGGGGEDVT